jgi:hypothetical protein
LIAKIYLLKTQSSRLTKAPSDSTTDSTQQGEASMATTVERLGIVETKVENLNEKLDDLKVDVKEMHDCLDQTRDVLAQQLKDMADSSTRQHAEIGKKISEMEKFKEKWTYMIAGGLVVASWASAHADEIISIIK